MGVIGSRHPLPIPVICICQSAARVLALDVGMLYRTSMKRCHWISSQQYVFAFLLLCLLTIGCPCAAQTENESVGDDLLDVFARAHRGQPLRVAVFGGSITQAGEGWIGSWLREQFPASAVSVRNAGMSATGSMLGVFRVERDVIASQPDIVFIEFAVNDHAASDEQAIRSLESIVVRLKQLDHPPAIVFLEAAARRGSKRYRHQRVARHYGLLDIDLQTVIDTYLEREDRSWSDLMSDNVHPNKTGHAVYARAIAEHLEPFVERARQHVRVARDTKTNLPAPLSEKALWLDGQLVPLDPAPGWVKFNQRNLWWDRFFTGGISSDTPGTELTLSARGTVLGLLYLLDSDDGGSFYASVDGNTPMRIDTDTRRGYAYRVLDRDLEAGEHLLTVAVAEPMDTQGAQVRLGYLLVAGGSASPDRLVPQQPIDLQEMALVKFEPIPAAQWRWAGPFGGDVPTKAEPTADFNTVFAPERDQAATVWQALEGDESWVDFARITGQHYPGVCYAQATIDMPEGGPGALALRVDYFAKVWLNGDLIATIDRTQYRRLSPMSPIIIPVEWQAAENALMIKVHSGSRGHGFSVNFARLQTTE